MKPICLLLALTMVACSGDSDSDDDVDGVEDVDGDGVLADFDCDDGDAALGAMASDADCDGVLTGADCDDADAAVGDRSTDLDCDGVATADDCDDASTGLGAAADDADCDGIATANDCDDGDPDVGGNADDSDCDGLANASDLCPDDADPTNLDLDQDGVGDACDADPELIQRSIPLGEVGDNQPQYWDCFDGFEDHCLTHSIGRPLYNPMLEIQYDYDSDDDDQVSPLGFLFNAGGGLSGEWDEGADSLTIGYAPLTGDNWKAGNNIGRTWGVRLYDPAAVEDEPTALDEWEFFLQRWHRYGRGGSDWIRSHVVTFSKADGVDGTLAENQDCISESVCLARGNGGSIYNAVSEDSAGATSPAGTQWFRGRAAWATSPDDFTDFITMHGGNPQGLLGEDISVYIEAEGRYYDVAITSFSGGGSGGGFALRRARSVVRGCGDASAAAYDNRTTWHVPEACTTGDEVYFEKMPAMDPDLSRWQDCISDTMCLTRDDDDVLYNEGEGTEFWALGASAEAEDAAYNEDIGDVAPGGRPQNLPNSPMSLRFANSDSSAWEYYDVTFHEWGPANGFMSYTRVPATGPATVPPTND